MNKCSLCSEEIKGKNVICKKCEENLKKTHPDNQKDNSIKSTKIFRVFVVLAVLVFAIILLKIFAGSFSNIFQLACIAFIVIVIMFQVIGRI